MRIKIILLVALIATSAINAQSKAPPDTMLAAVSGNIFESKEQCVKRHNGLLARLDATAKLLANQAVKTVQIKKNMAIVAARIFWFKKSMADCVDKAKLCAPQKPIPKPCVSTKDKCFEIHSGKCIHQVDYKCSPGYSLSFCKCIPNCVSPAKWDVKTSKCIKRPPFCGSGKHLVGFNCVLDTIICTKGSVKNELSGKCEPKPVTCKKPCKTDGTSCKCPTKCKKGFTLNKKTNECNKRKVICPVGQLKNKDKVCEQPEIDCQLPFVKKDNSCISVEVPKVCRADQKKKDGKCVDIKVCPKGYTLDKSLETCTKIEEECAEGWLMVNGVCKQNVETCPEDSKLDKEKNACIKVAIEC